MFRKSCGNCHFTNTKRPSDITIADFWGWENTDPAFNADNKGVSLVLLNTEKGRKLFEAVQDRMNTIPAELEKCLQPNLRVPSEIHPNRNRFEKDYEKFGFSYVFSHDYDTGLWYSTVKEIRIVKRKIFIMIGIPKRVVRKICKILNL